MPTVERQAGGQGDAGGLAVEMNRAGVVGGPLSDDFRVLDAREKEARLVVIGDADFASNAYQKQGANGDLFVNAVNWLAQEEDLISIRPKSQTNRDVQLSATAQNIFFWLTLLLPLAVIGAGIQTWWKRR